MRLLPVVITTVGLAAAAALAPPSATAQSVALSGVLGSKALLVIDGGTPRALAALPELAGAEFLHLHRDIAKRLVCEIRLNGRRAFLKQFHAGDPAAMVLAAAARLHEAAGILGQGADGVALPVLVLPEHGVIVTEAAPGHALSALLLRARSSRRAALVDRAGQWLEHLCRDSRELGTFGALYWLGTLDQRLAGGLPEWADQALVAAHMARMRTEAEPLRGISVERATAHGDLTPDNLFLDESVAPSRLTGIDMHHRASVPITRDMARVRPTERGFDFLNDLQALFLAD